MNRARDSPDPELEHQKQEGLELIKELNRKNDQNLLSEHKDLRRSNLSGRDIDKLKPIVIGFLSLRVL